MLHPARNAARISKVFSVADIENAKDGSVLAIGIYDGEEYRQLRTWWEWLAFMESRVDDPRYQTVYAHNGAGWDWLSLLEWILQNNLWDTLIQTPPVMADDDLLALNVTIAGVEVSLRDSLLLFRPEKADLDTLGKAFVGRGKADLDGKLPEYWYRRNPKLFSEYLRNDCTLLYEVLCNVCDRFYALGEIGRLGITAPSTAMRVFRTRFLRGTIGTPDNAELKHALRLAYHGGRVEVFRPGFHKSVRVYDVNSMYPAVMRDTPVPTTGKAAYTKRKHFDAPGIYYVRFQQKTDRPPLLTQGGEGVYSGEGWYFTPELRRFRGTLEVMEGWVFNEYDVIFASYVDTLYAERMKDKASPMAKIAKVCLNSLYGKFAQKPEKSVLVCCGVDGLSDYIAQGKAPVEVSAEYGLYRITEPSDVPHEHVGIAGMITSEARARLWESIDAKTIYCDTDSIHTTGRITTSDRLGDFKLEFEGEGVYAGKKLYSLRNADTEKVRAKGVRVGGKMGFKLGFSDLRRIAEGASVACEFVTAPTFSNVLKGGKSCTFDRAANRATHRNRTLKATYGNRNTDD